MCHLRSVVVDLIESEEKEPIQIGKRVIRDEDIVCSGGPPKIKRQNGLDPLIYMVEENETDPTSHNQENSQASNQDPSALLETYA